MSDDLHEQIARLEDERYAAMLAKDTGTLDRLLDDRLRYIHSSGLADSKESYIEGLTSGLFDYRAVSREEQTIVPMGDAALVFNRLKIDILVKGAERKVDSRALAVWSRSSGTWRLAAVLSASLAP